MVIGPIPSPGEGTWGRGPGRPERPEAAVMWPAEFWAVTWQGAKIRGVGWGAAQLWVFRHLDLDSGPYPLTNCHLGQLRTSCQLLLAQE